MVNISQIRDHLRVDSFEDDMLLQHYRDAAIDHLASIGVDMESTPTPPAIDQAVLLLVGHFYGHREATTPSNEKLNEIGVDRLIAPCREVAI